MGTTGPLPLKTETLTGDLGSSFYFCIDANSNNSGLYFNFILEPSLRQIFILSTIIGNSSGRCKECTLWQLLKPNTLTLSSRCWKNHLMLFQVHKEYSLSGNTTSSCILNYWSRKGLLVRLHLRLLPGMDSNKSPKQIATRYRHFGERHLEFWTMMKLNYSQANLTEKSSGTIN